MGVSKSLTHGTNFTSTYFGGEYLKDDAFMGSKLRDFSSRILSSKQESASCSPEKIPYVTDSSAGGYTAVRAQEGAPVFPPKKCVVGNWIIMRPIKRPPPSSREQAQENRWGKRGADQSGPSGDTARTAV